VSAPPGGLLDAVVSAARRTVESRREFEPLDRLAARAMLQVPKGDQFRARVSRTGAINVIAECKRRSPSKGILVADYDPARLAGLYADGGAAAISVLTEPTFFDGSLEHLQAVRKCVQLPLLRKDFIVEPYQLYEARANGADAVLLIVAALDGEALKSMLALAGELGLATLVEVHDARELDLGLDAGASIVGVNSRNLRTLVVDAEVCEALARRMPPHVVPVAESGLGSVASIGRMRGCGYAAVLVGEWLATHEDPVGVLRAISMAPGCKADGARAR
jgi:indole-3-glycerol phosphate synthase